MTDARSDERLRMAVAAALAEHAACSGDATTGVWRYICDCGKDMETTSIDHADILHWRHQVDALIEAVKGSGRLASDDLRPAVRRLTASLVAVHPLLNEPYTDMPMLTPWSRFVEPALRDLRDAAGMEHGPVRPFKGLDGDDYRQVQRMERRDAMLDGQGDW